MYQYSKYAVWGSTSSKTFRGAGWPSVHAGGADHCRYAGKDKGEGV